MKDKELEARLLDEQAAQETGIAKAQKLAAEADRLRRIGTAPAFQMPFLRN